MVPAVISNTVGSLAQKVSRKRLTSIATHDETHPPHPKKLRPKLEQVSRSGRPETGKTRQCRSRRLGKALPRPTPASLQLPNEIVLQVLKLYLDNELLTLFTIPEKIPEKKTPAVKTSDDTFTIVNEYADSAHLLAKALPAFRTHIKAIILEHEKEMGSLGYELSSPDQVSHAHTCQEREYGHGRWVLGSVRPCFVCATASMEGYLLFVRQKRVEQAAQMMERLDTLRA